MPALRGRTDANIHDRGHATTHISMPPVRLLDFEREGHLVPQGCVVRHLERTNADQGAIERKTQSIFMPLDSENLSVSSSHLRA